MDNESPQHGHGRPSPTLWRSLPPLWSNCLAGAWLGGYWPGAERWDRLAVLFLAASVLYAGGAFLESRRRMRMSAGFPWMAGVPLLLYPWANAVSSQPTLAAAVGEGTLVATYVFGSSILAQSDFLPPSRPPRWPWALMVLPLVVNAILSARFGPGHAIVVALPVFWLVRVAFGRTVPLGIGRGAALRAGSVLVDLSAVVACTAFLPWLGWFAILFALALVCERLAPAG